MTSTSPPALVIAKSRAQEFPGTLRVQTESVGVGVRVRVRYGVRFRVRVRVRVRFRVRVRVCLAPSRFPPRIKARITN